MAIQRQDLGKSVRDLSCSRCQLQIAVAVQRGREKRLPIEVREDALDHSRNAGRCINSERVLEWFVRTLRTVAHRVPAEPLNNGLVDTRIANVVKESEWRPSASGPASRMRMASSFTSGPVGVRHYLQGNTIVPKLLDQHPRACR